MLKYVSKFTMDILPSVVATIIGAYIVNHYIATKPATDAPVAAADLLPKIKAIRETRSEAESVVYLRGDKDVCYTDMMKLLGQIRTAGFKANIVIIPEQGS